MMKYESVIGLEVHVQLRTATKIFCRCPNRFGAQPNSIVCEVCAGYPGALPVLGSEAVDQAVRLSLALGATVQERSIFARKSYFYADSPKGYQISQFDRPLAVEGSLPLGRHDRSIRIERLHLEEDAGKLLHEAPGGLALGDESLVDLDRCGVPLLEIVTYPVLRTPAEAHDYLQSLHRVLLYTGTSDGNMEEGSLRCDANVSVRPEGESRLGTRTEIKNLNSFRHVARALEYEIDRQVRSVESDIPVEQQTLSWDAAKGETRPLRSKEEAQDYRYFPEPDLPPLVVTAERQARLAAELPEMPWDRRRRFEQELELNSDAAEDLVADPAFADYFETAIGLAPSLAQPLANWVRNELRRSLEERGRALEEAVSPDRLVDLVNLVDRGTVSSSAAKQVFEAMWSSEGEAAALAEELGLVRESNPTQHLEWMRQVVDGHPAQAEAYRGGKAQIAGFFIGRAMALSRGKADPALLRSALVEILPPGEGEVA